MQANVHVLTQRLRVLLCAASLTQACTAGIDAPRAERLDAADAGASREPSADELSARDELEETPPTADLVDAELQDGVDLQEAPGVEDMLRAGVEPLGVEIPPELSAEIEQDAIPKRVIGADGRVAVTNTKVQPNSTIATLLITFPGASGVGLCTGSIIRPDAVLTAGHCAYSKKYGAFASNIRVIPGTYPDAHNLPAQPFGSASGKKLFVPSAYRASGNFWTTEPHDYAVVRLTSPLGAKTGVRAYGVLAEPSVGRAIRLVGYHGDRCAAPPCVPAADAFVMQSSGDAIRQTFTGMFNHYADSNPGSSGSPLVSDGAYANKIVAVHVAGLHNPSNNAEWNMGVLITSAAYANIKNWSERSLAP